MKNIIDKLIHPDMWIISGNFKHEKGSFSQDAGKTVYETSKFKVTTEYKEDDQGVFRLSGKIIAKEDIVLRGLDIRFVPGGGEFEVYTQYNGWQNESRGGWQELNTSVSAEGKYSRTSSGANPFMAIWNRQTSRGMAFHLLPDFAWEIKASYESTGGECADNVICIGINKENLSISLEKGNSINTPDIILYEFTNKLDMDCYKLHNWWHNNFDKMPCPVTYNTWLANFDKINYENVYKQIGIAARLGAEYFVIDAGWFGKGDNWWDSRGDWSENSTGGLCGRMKDISDEVRKNNMKFGLWFEIESASSNSDIVKNHPEYFIIRDDLCFLDFGNENACEYITETIGYNIEKYNIEYIKFDYNQDMRYDDSQRAFIGYFEGYFKTIGTIKNKFPNVFFENCASGGQRMNLKNCIDFDGFWPSDNESPYEQLRIFKDTVLRLPPQYFDRWITVASLENFVPVYGDQNKEKILACNDATWEGVASVDKSFLTGFLSGGQIGISCDLTKFSDDLSESLKEHIDNVKKERAFWDSAVCRILASTDEVLVIQYSDMALNEIKIIVFSFKTRQNKLYIYPVTDKDGKYLLNDCELCGRDIESYGIETGIKGNYKANFIELKKTN